MYWEDDTIWLAIWSIEDGAKLYEYRRHLSHIELVRWVIMADTRCGMARLWTRNVYDTTHLTRRTSLIEILEAFLVIAHCTLVWQSILAPIQHATYTASSRVPSALHHTKSSDRTEYNIWARNPFHLDQTRETSACPPASGCILTFALSPFHLHSIQTSYTTSSHRSNANSRTENQFKQRVSRTKCASAYFWTKAHFRHSPSFISTLPSPHPKKVRPKSIKQAKIETTTHRVCSTYIAAGRGKVPKCANR
jgi:hypothetical protein